MSLLADEDLVIEEELTNHLIFLNEKYVIHSVYMMTRFSAATFLDSFESEYGQTAESIWTAFMLTCRTMYPGYPNRLKGNRGFCLPLTDGTIS